MRLLQQRKGIPPCHRGKCVRWLRLRRIGMSVPDLHVIADLPGRLRAKIRLESPPADPCARPVPGLCWTWTAAVNNRGYGYTSFGRSNRWLVHRWTYTQFVGPIPDGLEIDHLCRNIRCCNPAHLEPVTVKVNQERGVRRQATHCQRGHEFSGHNLIVTTDGRRECRACKYASQRRAVTRRRAAGLSEGHRLHGTITGYVTYACRCDQCRAAGAAAWQRNPVRSRRGAGGVSSL